MFISVSIYFFIDSVAETLDTPSYNSASISMLMFGVLRYIKYNECLIQIVCIIYFF